jgi:Fe-S-cluster containining protein
VAAATVTQQRSSGCGYRLLISPAHRSANCMIRALSFLCNTCAASCDFFAPKNRLAQAPDTLRRHQHHQRISHYNRIVLHVFVWRDVASLWRCALAGPPLCQTVSMAVRCRQGKSADTQHTTRLPTVCTVCPDVRAAARSPQPSRHRPNGGEEVDFVGLRWSNRAVPSAAASVGVSATWPAHNIAIEPREQVRA